MRDDAGKRKLKVVKRKKGLSSDLFSNSYNTNGKVSAVLINASESVRGIALVAANLGGGLAGQNSDNALRIACGRLTSIFTSLYLLIHKGWPTLADWNGPPIEMVGA
jgi:hypothetical protein